MDIGVNLKPDKCGWDGGVYDGDTWVRDTLTTVVLPLGPLGEWVTG